jgi:chromosomal replication initiation ATPase DnaA
MSAVADRSFIDHQHDGHGYEIARVIAGRFRIPLGKVIGPATTPGARQPMPTRARTELYRALRERGWSTPEIGAFCGGRHHTTVLAALGRLGTKGEPR